MHRVDVVGTRQECVGSLSRVSRVFQDGAREFARRRSRLAKKLSGVAKKLAGRLTMTGVMELQLDDGPRSSLSIGPGFRRCSGISSKFARRFIEGIVKLTRNTLGEDQKTCCKNAEGCRISGIGFWLRF
ncbi:hypothetical protein B296_00013876 [Ensete ventricosum]|uniref:Uncharacterized protein n=1 Tax=Ensete ventricosum TaxID=4639 RepID=A0A427AVW6_ENSVE|nr:hypothetical protein B296_00013876 [Ensete ventricosum]